MNEAFKSLLRPAFRPARRMLQRLGYDVVAMSSPEAGQDPRMYWIERLGVDGLIDVGANAGQYVGWMRDRGYRGPILSLEPQPDAFEACKARWSDDPRWQGVCCAVGAEAGEMTLQVAGNSFSSSLLPMLQSHVDALPESAIVDTRNVPVRRLDEVVGSALGSAKALFLKIDTQGFELPVLQGADGILDRVVAVELELSLVPLYDGQELLPRVWSAVESMGFEPVWLEPGFADAASRRLLQADAIFARKTTS
ncbi:MAG: FkbM family methyltransferase [Actinomycetota bacterium]